MEIKPHISLAKATNKSPNLLTNTIIRNFQIDSDEPIDRGGQNLAPTPFDLLNSALASCTSIYLRVISNKNNINTGTIVIKIKISLQEDKNLLFDRTITIEKEITKEQKEFLLEQSNFSPTTIILKKGNTINTTLIN